ncbi:hypothetical protein H2O84_002744 [Listeria monocytogenes]|uniref:cyclic-phosphate processing receiver domain-containing protein n=1 Tax=Listeria seeligeri TaxID=1640 RepID=UPI001D6ACC04|nr:cyclic-phosphate processing receiver domain-containing protein [Listeria seeligeri]EFS0529382.1 hypothetical protein [Listeria monocytogenes]EFU8668362.1 hypothetical protein [Listeria monocytogenes]
MNIFIDDLRLAPEKYNHSFLTAESFFSWCEAHDYPTIELLSLDHDLGDGFMDGFDLVKKIVELCMPVKRVQFHTDNIIGLKNMYYYLKNATECGLLPDLQHIDKRKIICIDGVESIAPYMVM